MAIILNIDTSQDGIYISISNNGICKAYRQDIGKNTQALLLNTFVQEVLQESNMQFNHIQAVSILSGPGSYTGLRVGMASAKGFCMALDIPLIAINNLHALAYCYIADNELSIGEITAAFLPMANEIIYSKFSFSRNNSEIIVEPNSNIKYSSSADFEAINSLIIKAENNIIKTTNTDSLLELPCINWPYKPAIVNELSELFFIKKDFANLQMAEPTYVKEAYIQTAKK